MIGSKSLEKLNTQFVDYSVFSGSLKQLPSTSRLVINTINQYSFCIAEQDSEFKIALKKSDILLPDGIGITSGSKLLYGKKISKIAGADIHQFLLEKLNRESGSVFYLGSSKTTLLKIRKRIANEYPNIKISTYSPPYKPIFAQEDNAKMIQAINTFKPDILFVGMTAPKQEKWSYMNKETLNAKIICSIGAVFDFYAGTIKRPNQIWISLGLEWLGRLIKEPKRMWKRYIYYGVVFVKYLCFEKYNILKKKKN